VPDLVRLGTRVSPQLERVRHRLMPDVTAHDVDVEVVDGVRFASSSPFVSRARLGGSIDQDVTIAGVSTSHAIISPFELVSTMMRPDKSALWTLRADSPIPKQLAVRLDPKDSSHVLWAPRDRMPLDAYGAALHCVGRDANGALVDWTAVADPLALLDSFPLPAEEKQRVKTTAEKLVSLRRSRPIICPEVVARAVLGFCLESLDELTADIEFLTSMAELATTIVDDGAWGPFAASCHILASSVASVPRASRVVPALETCSGKRLFSTPAFSGQHAIVTMLVHLVRQDAERARELQFIRDAMLAARDELMLGMPALQADEAWDALEVQFDLARDAAREMGFMDLIVELHAEAVATSPVDQNPLSFCTAVAANSH